jgi:hypothetical protein
MPLVDACVRCIFQWFTAYDVRVHGHIDERDIYDRLEISPIPQVPFSPTLSETLLLTIISTFTILKRVKTFLVPAEHAILVQFTSNDWHLVGLIHRSQHVD